MSGLKKEKVSRFGVSIEKELLGKFDKYLEALGIPNRSEAISDIIRDKLTGEKINHPNVLCFGIITYVYDHHRREIEKKLNRIQHDHFRSIIFTSHVHIDHDNCLEIIVVKDKGGVISGFTEKVLALKGVKHGKFVLTSLIE